MNHGSHSDEYSTSSLYEYVSMHTHTTFVLHFRVPVSLSHDLQPRVNTVATSTLCFLL